MGIELAIGVTQCNPYPVLRSQGRLSRADVWCLMSDVSADTKRVNRNQQGDVGSNEAFQAVGTACAKSRRQGRPGQLHCCHLTSSSHWCNKEDWKEMNQLYFSASLFFWVLLCFSEVPSGAQDYYCICVKWLTWHCFFELTSDGAWLTSSFTCPPPSPTNWVLFSILPLWIYPFQGICILASLTFLDFICCFRFTFSLFYDVWDFPSHFSCSSSCFQLMATEVSSVHFIFLFCQSRKH